MPPVSAMHEGMHEHATEQQKGCEPVARKQMDAVFISQQQGSDGSKDDESYSGAGSPKTRDRRSVIGIVAMIVIAHGFIAF